MRTIAIVGRTEIATQLRTIAEDIEHGEMTLGDGHRVSCPEDMVAVLEWPSPDGPERRLVVHLWYEDGGRRPTGTLAAEQELAHPGG